MMDRVGRLWLKTSKKGDKFMSGVVEIGGQKVDVLVFKNNRKRPDKRDPDYDIFRAEPREDIPEAAPRPSAHGDDSDLPF